MKIIQYCVDYVIQMSYISRTLKFKTMKTTRTVISESRKRKTCKDGSLNFMQMVVYKTKINKKKHTSITKHEIKRSNNG